MLDEARAELLRLERLRELARGCCVLDPDVKLLSPQMVQLWDGPIELVTIGGHPKCLDGLEAAILVMSGKAPLVAAGQGAMCMLARDRASDVREASEAELRDQLHKLRTRLDFVAQGIDRLLKQLDG